MPNIKAIQPTFIILQMPAKVMSVIFSPGESIIIKARGRVEQPIEGSGEIYLTNRRILLVHRAGMIRKRETPLLDVKIEQVSYFKVEGLLRKVLVLGVISNAGVVISYKVHVPAPESWASALFSLKRESQKS